MKRQLACLAGLAIVGLCLNNFSRSSSSYVSLTDVESESLVGAIPLSYWVCGTTPGACTACTPHSCKYVPDGIITNRYCTNDGSSGCSLSWASRFTCWWTPVAAIYSCDSDLVNSCGFERVPGTCAAAVRNVAAPGFFCPAAPACGVGAGIVRACNSCS